MVRSEERALSTPLQRLREDLDAIVRAALAASDAGVLLDAALANPVTDSRLHTDRLFVIAAGKAAPAMLDALARRHEPHIHRALLISPRSQPASAASGTPPGRLRGGAASTRGAEVVHAGHPAPDEGSLRAGREALQLAASLDTGDTLVVLLSGGASALMTLPVDGVTLADKAETARMLMAAGADIHALNTVRKHLSRIKGGRLAAACPGAVLSFVLSDVVGNDLAVIGSGPTVADPTTFADAVNVLSRFGVRDRLPPAVVGVLERGAAGRIDDTPKPGCAALARAETRLIGSLADALHAATAAASARGYRVAVIDEPIVGEARLAGTAHGGRVLRETSGLERPVCVISGGETTVTVRGGGRGGRNQEFMLAAAGSLSKLGTRVAAASVGTDGIDGPTDAAGAMIDTDTPDRLRGAQIDVERTLADNDAYAAFDAIDQLIRTGPTGTNVGDLQVVLIDG